MEKRSSFPRVFWVANSIEVMERFAHYGIYFGFGIYRRHWASFSGIVLTMLSIGLAAGMFKPLIAATVRPRSPKGRVAASTNRSATSWR